MVAAVVRRQKLIGMLRIPKYAIEIDHCIEVPGAANPAIHGLPIGLTQRPRDDNSLNPHRA